MSAKKMQVKFTADQLDQIKKLLSDAGIYDSNANRAINVVDNNVVAKGAFSSVYSYVYSIIKDSPYVDAKTKFWFSQAPAINADNRSIDGDNYIRGATQYGLAFRNAINGLSQNDIDTGLQQTSNLIGQNVVNEILDDGGLAVFPVMLSGDISAAIGNNKLIIGGHNFQQTIGGWGGAFYYWNQPLHYGDPILQQSVGSAIQNGMKDHSGSSSLNEFLYANGSAMADFVISNGMIALASGAILSLPAIPLPAIIKNKIEAFLSLKNVVKSAELALTSGSDAEAPNSVKAEIAASAIAVLLGRYAVGDFLPGPHNKIGSTSVSSTTTTLSGNVLTTSYADGRSYTINLADVNETVVAWQDASGNAGSITMEASGAFDFVTGGKNGAPLEVARLDTDGSIFDIVGDGARIGKGSDGTLVLAGGSGNDVFDISAPAAGKTVTIKDTDGIGGIKVADVALDTTAATVTGKYSWEADGVAYTFTPDTPGLDVGTLTISGGSALGDSKIAIQGFDLDKAESKDGFLGIKFGQQIALGASNPFDQGNYAPSDVVENSKGAIQAFNVYVSADAAASGQSIVLSLAGGAPANYAINTGAGFVDFGADGKAVVTIPAGADQISLGLVYKGDPTASSTVTLTSALLDGSAGLSSNKLTLTFDHSGAPVAAQATGLASITGVQGKDTVDGQQVTVTKYTGDENGDLVVAGDGFNYIHLGNGDNSVVGGSGSDTVYSGGGNSTIHGGGGQDYIFADRGGDNVITADGGQDVIYAGYGHNQIYGGGQEDLAAAIAASQSAVASHQKGSFYSVGGDSTVVGGTGNDVIMTSGNTLVVAGPGSDTIIGGVSGMGVQKDWNTVLNGGRVIFSNASLNTTGNYTGSGVYEGVHENGPDSAPVGVGNDTILGGSGSHVILLSNGNNYVDLGSGNSSVTGGMGNNTIFGGSGDVTIIAGGGNDYIRAEDGDDYISGGNGNNTIIGGAGRSIIYAGNDGSFGQLSTANGGNNFVEAGSGDTVIFGSGGNDTLIGGSGRDSIVAGDGNTTIQGGSGVTSILGGAGQDVIYAGDGGTSDDPTIVMAGSGATTIHGGNGVDSLVGGSGNTVIYAGDGASTIVAGSGPTTVYGGSATDVIVGGTGADVLYAGDGGTDALPTVLRAGSGADTLVAGAGTSQILCGTGPNTVGINADLGQTVIFDLKSSDVIRFGDDISPDSLLVTMELYNDGTSGLIVRTATGGQATILGGLDTGAGVFQFADGQQMSTAQLLQIAASTSTDLSVNGTNVQFSAYVDATLTASGTRNKLYGFGAESVLVAGAGTNKLVGGGGNDTYVIKDSTSATTVEQSMASDALQFGEGIHPGDLSATVVVDANGTSTVTIHMAAGGSVSISGKKDAMLDKVVFSDGTSTTLDQLAAGGAYSGTSDDGQGNVTITLFSANGAKLSDSWKKADGSSGTDVFNTDGSHSGTIRNADGTVATFENDGHGSVATHYFDVGGTPTGTSVTTANAMGQTTTNYDAAGTRTDDSWTRSDGSHGTDVFLPDGSSTGSSSGYPDGSTAISTDDGHGNRTVNFSKGGVRISDAWNKADGTHGLDFFYSGGSSEAVVYQKDGAYSITTDNGHGITERIDYDALGSILSDQLSGQGDTTHVSNPDGTSATTASDGAGNTTTAYYRADGFKYQQAWTHDDGSYGADFYGSTVVTGHGGVYLGYAYTADGSHTDFYDDGAGLTSAVSFDSQGNVTGTRDRQANGLNNVVTTYYDAAGNRINETWSHSDGTTGGDVLATPDFAGMASMKAKYPAGATASWALGTSGRGGNVVTLDGNGKWVDDEYGYVTTLGQHTLAGVGYQIEIQSWTPAGADRQIGSVTFTDGVTGLMLQIDAFDNGAYRSYWGSVFDGVTKTPDANGKVYSPNGTYSVFQAGENSSVTDYDANGNKIGDLWVHNDGSYGFDVYDASGASDGLWVNSATVAHSTSDDGSGHGMTESLAPAPVSQVYNALSSINLAPAATYGSGVPGGGAWGKSTMSGVDASGASFTISWGWDGSATLSRAVTYTQFGSTYQVDPNGKTKVVSSSTVDTDPGYSSVVSIDGVTKGWRYDAAGKPASSFVDDGQGTRTTYSYDSAGHVAGYVIARQDGSGKLTSVRYDATGNIVGTSVQAVDATGTVVTTQFDTSGRVQGSIRLLEDGKGNSVTYTLDGNGNLLGSKTTVMTGSDTTTITEYGADGKAKGAYVTVRDASGSILTSNYDGNGQLLGSVVATPDANGNVATSNYDAQGKLTSYVILKTDGQNDTTITVFDAGGTLSRKNQLDAFGTLVATQKLADGSTRTTTHNTDRSYTVAIDDGQGNVTTTLYSAQDVKLSDTWTRGDLSIGKDSFQADGSASGNVTYTNGTSASYVRDALGQVTTTRYAADGKTVTGSTVVTNADGVHDTDVLDASGRKTSDAWTKADGSSGTDTFSADGSSARTWREADGSYGNGGSDGKGNTWWSSYSSAGVLTGHFTGHADGSSETVLYKPDGSSSQTTKAATGDTTTFVFDASGTQIGFAWSKPDGSHGSTSQLADGSSTSETHNADGSYNTSTSDGKGSTASASYAADGFKTGDAWRKPDGSSGQDSYGRDGAVSRWAFDAKGQQISYMSTQADGRFYSSVLNADQTFTVTERTSPDSHDRVTETVEIDNANGRVGGYTTRVFDPAGNVLTTEFDATGAQTSISWKRSDGTTGTGDGSSTSVTTDAAQRRITARLDLFGIVQSDTWTAADGSHGEDTFNPDGSSSGDATYADGSTENYRNDSGGGGERHRFNAAGNEIETYHAYSDGTWSSSTQRYDATGFMTGDTWTNSNGSHGADSYSPDGSSSGINYDAKGGWYKYAGDATHDQWSQSDGSYGSDNYGADGSSSGTAINADGSSFKYQWAADGSNTSTTTEADGRYSVYTADGHGNWTTAQYDENGTKYADHWYKADGTSGDDVFPVPAATPVVAHTLIGQDAQQGKSFSLAIPAGTFSESVAGDVLKYSASLAGGGALPAWLHYDAGTNTLSGTPGKDDVGSLIVKVTATEDGGLKASTTFTLAVAAAAGTPVVNVDIKDQLTSQRQPFTFTVPTDTFTDTAGNAMHFHATQPDGSALPAWLTFDEQTMTFSGTPGDNDAGAFAVRLIATDPDGQTADVDFGLTVNYVNRAPSAVQALEDVATNEFKAFQWTVPATAFADPDKGDTLSYSATMEDGSALPAWLKFDSVSRTFFGTPGDENVTTLRLTVQASDQSSLSASASFTLSVNHVNLAPQVATPLMDVITPELAPFKFVVPASTFKDPNSKDVLAFSAALADGSPLPAWLSFDAATATFTGTPGDDAVGTLALKVTATDAGGLSASAVFKLGTSSVNAAPQLNRVIADQVADELSSYRFVIPVGTFTDPNSHDQLTYSVTQADGKALPTWLHFDPATRTFSGIAGDDDVGPVTVKVVATDPAGLTSSATFGLDVRHVNAAPVRVADLAAQAVDELKPYRFTVPANTFTDPNAHDVLSYRATHADGSALPAWLSFDERTQTFSGTPGDGDTGTYAVKVIATDSGGLDASASFTLAVNHVNLAPVLVNSLSDQSATGAKVFQFTVPGDTFADPNKGDVLQYSASLAGGGALPAWLSFDAATGTFRGTPAAADAELLDVVVTAKDAGGLTAQAGFKLTVASAFAAPVVAQALSDQAAGELTRLVWTIPAGTFTDPNKGGVLNFAASMANGSPLPSWLAFDPATATFSGTPADADIGSLSVKVTATDSVGGLSVSDGFTLTVQAIDTLSTAVSMVLPDHIHNLAGTGSADIILTGNALDNVITANGGNDTLIAGTGKATLVGGLGNDTFVVNSIDDVVVEHVGGGVNALRTSVSYVLPANVQNLQGSGSAGLVLTGNDLDNVIVANDGNDTLVAGTGNATLVGGRGNTTFVLNRTSDVVQAQAGAANIIRTSVDYTAAANVRTLIGTGAANLTLRGNDMADTIVANDGNDTLIAGSGVATLVGGAGNDTFVINNVADVIVEMPNGGIDTLLTSVSYVLPANVQNITATGDGSLTLTGNDLSNIITANGGNDTLIAGAGSATLIGGTGNTTFVINSNADVVQAKAGGVNTVTTSVDYVAGLHIAKVTATGNAALTLTGNELANVLTANNGNDTLVAGSGVATLVGGAGNDTFVINNASDVIVEQPNGGHDTLITSVSFVLPANVADITGVGKSSLTLTGNGQSNLITANDAGDTLVAGSGVATLVGGAGDDTFVVNNANDVIVERVGGGMNREQSSVSLTLAANVQNLEGTGKSDLALTGNALDNVITANGGNDTLAGGGGNDTLVGGVGHTTYVYSQGDGRDTVIAGTGTNMVRFGKGLTSANVVIRLTAADGSDFAISEDANGHTHGATSSTASRVLTAHVDILDSHGVVVSGQGMTFTAYADSAGNVTAPVSLFQFVDGSNVSLTDMLVKTGTLRGNETKGEVTAGRDDLAIYAGAYTTDVRAGSGNDTIYGGSHGTVVYGGGGTDYFVGAQGNDTFVGGWGTSIVQAGKGNDSLTAANGDAVILGAGGADTLVGGAHRDFLAGGAGNDDITIGSAGTVLAFNKGDGQDAVHAVAGSAATLSLGGGINEADLVFARAGNDLVLGTGGKDTITLKGWYSNAEARNVGTLQVIEAASKTYDGKSSNVLVNSKVETFDFGKLVAQFDQATAANAKLSSWSLMNGLLNDHLSGSDGAAVGGDLAYYYGMNGSLSGMDLSVVAGTVREVGFGAGPQTVDNWSGISRGEGRVQ